MTTYNNCAMIALFLINSSPHARRKIGAKYVKRFFIYYNIANYSRDCISTITCKEKEIMIEVTFMFDTSVESIDFFNKYVQKNFAAEEYENGYDESLKDYYITIHDVYAFFNSDDFYELIRLDESGIADHGIVINKNSFKSIFVCSER